MFMILNDLLPSIRTPVVLYVCMCYEYISQNFKLSVVRVVR